MVQSAPSAQAAPLLEASHARSASSSSGAIAYKLHVLKRRPLVCDPLPPRFPVSFICGYCTLWILDGARCKDTARCSLLHLQVLTSSLSAAATAAVTCSSMLPRCLESKSFLALGMSTSEGADMTRESPLCRKDWPRGFCLGKEVHLWSRKETTMTALEVCF